MPFCGNCGIEIDDGTRCSVCAQPLSKPKADFRSVAIRRCCAGAIDLLFATAVALGIAAWMFAMKKIIPIPGLRKIIGLTLPIAFWVLYLLLKDSFGGKSLGKALCNLTVVNRWGRPAGIVDSINRNWPIWLPPLTLIVGLQLIMGRQIRMGETQGTAVVHDDLLA